MNQQITFLSDGEETVRDLQFYLSPEPRHILDWFHLAMRLTVLDQYTKGLVHHDQQPGEEIRQKLERLKWALWHGNLYQARHKIDDIESLIYNFEESYPKFKQLAKAVEEFRTYIANNGHLIPTDGERWRYGEAIATGFVESTVNQMVSKRFCKRQQRQSSPNGAHLLLQTRVKTLNNELAVVFRPRYPDFPMEEEEARAA
jgi:virulence-associated protein VapD